MLVSQSISYFPFFLRSLLFILTPRLIGNCFDTRTPQTKLMDWSIPQLFPHANLYGRNTGFAPRKGNFRRTDVDIAIGKCAILLIVTRGRRGNSVPQRISDTKKQFHTLINAS